METSSEAESCVPLYGNLARRDILYNERSLEHCCTSVLLALRFRNNSIDHPHHSEEHQCLTRLAVVNASSSPTCHPTSRTLRGTSPSNKAVRGERFFVVHVAPHLTHSDDNPRVIFAEALQNFIKRRKRRRGMARGSVVVDLHLNTATTFRDCIIRAPPDYSLMPVEVRISLQTPTGL